MKLPIDTNIFPRKKGVYIVGGSIRDLLCGRTPLDYDLVVKGDPELFARSLASRVSGRFVEIGKQGQTVRRVVAKDIIYDILPVNGVSIDDDLRLRDFTVNAMAVAAYSGNLIDRLGGLRDLAAKKIRMVSDDVFRKDPVRLLRAYRLAASFGFSIDSETRRALARDANLITVPAAERIRDELFKTLQCARSHEHLVGMADSGLLFRVFPELLDLANCRLPCKSHPNLFEQTLDCLNHLEKMLDGGEEFKGMFCDPLFQEIDTDRATLLKWSILFHDIGKPKVRKSGEGGNIHFRGHAAKSAAMARKICQRLKFSKRQADWIVFIIACHLRPFFLFRAQRKNIPDQIAFTRFFMKCRDLTPDILLHAMAEFKGTNTTNRPSDIDNFTDFISSLIQYYYSVLQPRASMPPPLNGNDLINEFGLKPSAEFKRILSRLEEKNLSGPLTRDQALKLVGKMLKR